MKYLATLIAVALLSACSKSAEAPKANDAPDGVVVEIPSDVTAVDAAADVTLAMDATMADLPVAASADVTASGG